MAQFAVFIWRSKASSIMTWVKLQKKRKKYENLIKPRGKWSSQFTPSNEIGKFLYMLTHTYDRINKIKETSLHDDDELAKTINFILSFFCAWAFYWCAFSSLISVLCTNYFRSRSILWNSLTVCDCFYMDLKSNILFFLVKH